jgi:hypothetical protein
LPTVVDIPEQELAELKAFTTETEAVTAVRLAMTDSLRLARRLQLKTMPGQVEVEDHWKNLEEAEQRNRENSYLDSVAM